MAHNRARASGDSYSDGIVSDEKLIALSRAGDTAAYAELWRRHSAAGLAVARSYTSGFDPDDVVSEAFAKILKAVQSGGGPKGAFRPYLFTTIRNTAAGWGRARHEIPIEHAEEIEDPEFSEENTLNSLDRSLTATAFRSLPTRWQEALWYSEVEQMTPQQIGPLLGMKANAVAALTYRAREGLRQAWIQAHLASLPAGSDCRWTVDRLGGYARKSLGKRETVRVERHLAGCARCTIVAAEADEVGSRLALVLLPLVAGVAGAAAYSAFMQSGGHVAMLALGAGGAVGGSAGGAGGTGTVATGSSSGGTTLGSSGAVIGTISVAALAVAGVVAALVFGPVLFRGATPPPPSIVAAAPTQAPDAPKSPESQPTAPDVVRPPVADTTTPPVAPLTDSVDQPDADPATTQPVTAPEPPVTQPTTPTPPTSPPVTSTDPPPTDPPTATVPAAPEVDVDTGHGLYYPVLSGTSEPNAVITISEAAASADAATFAAASTTDPSAETPVTVTADDAGAWTAPQIPSAGPFSVTQTTSDGSSPAKTVEIDALDAPTAPIISAPTGTYTVIRYAAIVPITITGEPGTMEVFVDGISLGQAMVPYDGLLLLGGEGVGTYNITVRYVTDDQSRFGPESEPSTFTTTPIL